MQGPGVVAGLRSGRKWQRPITTSSGAAGRRNSLMIAGNAFLHSSFRVGKTEVIGVDVIAQEVYGAPHESGNDLDPDHRCLLRQGAGAA
jgi:hypothetical protein